MTLGTRAGFAFLATALVGCDVHEPRPVLSAIEPKEAHSDQDVRVLLLGAGLLPSFRINPNTDERVAIMDGFSGRIGKDPIWARLTLFDWLGPERISATLPREEAGNLVRSPPICPCDVEITDPRGHKAIQPSAFNELGPDKQAPTITVESPVAGKRYCPGGTLDAHFAVSDPLPGHLHSVTWTLNGPSRDQILLSGRCPFDVGASRIECAFDVDITGPLASVTELYLFVKAVDGAENESPDEATATVVLSEPPKANSVEPSIVPTTGGTDIIIRGSGFDSDSRAYFGDSLLYPLYPDGGRVSKDGTVISGYTPAHPAGITKVRVVSRLGEVSAAFEFVDSQARGTP